MGRPKGRKSTARTRKPKDLLRDLNSALDELQAKLKTAPIEVAPKLAYVCSIYHKIYEQVRVLNRLKNVEEFIDEYRLSPSGGRKSEIYGRVIDISAYRHTSDESEV